MFEIINNKVVMDVRERIARGEHPRGEILQYIKHAPIGTIFEIHLPFRPEPLIANIQSLGMNVIVNELEPHHVRLMTVKLDEI
ncbi:MULTISPECIES: DUF2249 domain-containing protein [Neobacillus]|jgi:hypothetical protein|uniref:DUF2249 domain-containing protein n=2 Tax=Neobacillus TaxID=2675232 RepID=A0A6B3TUM4_9BACI|nr:MULTISPECIES: DUF2249 domain-containing protein [Neobacillus]AIM17144.1 amino acid decarboxylase [Bacillus sp. X1(2014)]MCD4838282.1 DUF2249 domain-containing protein [Neobacillus sedimentimangrovi]MED3625203.1 DUF2249 domain-containing protein [Neobacillus thermocopriae]MED3715117.1 DUF2249 domain-containing protein [Neobacillus thermocopriae]NEX80036.1 DUF2249 domain-containing protein [Neobacillus thermocopriae]